MKYAFWNLQNTYLAKNLQMLDSTHKKKCLDDICWFQVNIRNSKKRSKKHNMIKVKKKDSRATSINCRSGVFFC